MGGSGQSIGETLCFLQSRRMRRTFITLAAAMAAMAPVAVLADILGDAYRAYGSGHFADAAQLLLPLAEEGRAEAQLYLGKMYADGEGVTQDFQLSLHWYLKAADQGLAAAQASVGAAYMAGLGVLRDNILAHMWFTAAAANGPYTAGGVLGQTIVSAPGIMQGYVVAINGQANPASTVNPPQPQPSASGNPLNVTIGGVRQPVTSCSPCVTLGLTPQMLGQFAPFQPSGTTVPGLVPWTSVGTNFPNPYGSGPGNVASTEFGYRFAVRLTSPSGVTAAVQALTLLDTGTRGFTLALGLNQPGLTTTYNGTTYVQGGVTLTASGLANGLAVSGLPTSAAVISDPGYSPITYQAGFDSGLNGPGATSTIGLSFFLQNSVMFDLSNNAVGYTPFFVTDANLVTTANGPLIVDATNVPLGLAGVISGPGGVTVNPGGQLQLSATNT